jgi:ADP-dependent NAD(P)H-hydrate dehydratase / NAD(P)H-hydrate epimerase
MSNETGSSVKPLSIHDVQSLLPTKKLDGHKGQHGKLLIVAGDEGYGGAGILVSEAAIKTGTGLVKLLTREAYVSAALARNPEVMVYGGENAQNLEMHFPWAEVFLCGPGMFQNYWSEQLLYKLLIFTKEENLPILLDAGALRLLSMEPFKQMSLPQNLIITPHPGEAANLLGTTPAVVQANRLKAAKDLHMIFGGTVVLKGHGTIIFDGNTCHLCSVGGPELAVAGSGDVLSGIIGSLLSQGLTPGEAAISGVAIHSNAGKQFAQHTGTIGLAASELISYARNLLN